MGSRGGGAPCSLLVCAAPAQPAGDSLSSLTAALLLSSSTIHITRKCWHMLLNLCFHIAMTSAVFAGGITLTGYLIICQAVRASATGSPQGNTGTSAASVPPPPAPVPTIAPRPAGRHHFALLLPVHAAVDGGEGPGAVQGGDLEGAPAAGRGRGAAGPSAHATVPMSPCPSLAGQQQQQRCPCPCPDRLLGPPGWAGSAPVCPEAAAQPTSPCPVPVCSDLLPPLAGST